MSDEQVDEINRRLSELLSRAREEKGVSKRTLAKESGLNRATILFIEMPEQNPTIKTLLRYSLALGVDLGAMIQSSMKKIEDGDSD